MQSSAMRCISNAMSANTYLLGFLRSWQFSQFSYDRTGHEVAYLAIYSAHFPEIPNGRVPFLIS